MSKSILYEILSGSSKSFIIKVIGVGLAFSLHIILARLMDIDNYGVYVYALSWVALTGFIAKVGFDSALIRFIPQYYEHKKWGLLKGVIKFSSITTIIFSCFVSLIFVVTSIYLLPESKGLSLTFILAALLIPFQNLSELLNAIQQALKNITYALGPWLVFRPVAFIVVITGYWYFVTQQKNVAAETGIIVNVSVTIFLTILLIYLAKSKIPKPTFECEPEYQKLYWAKNVLPFMVLAGSSVFISQTDVVMVGSIIGATKSGIYSVASRVSTLVTFGLDAVNILVAPMIATYFANNQIEKLKEVVSISAYIIFGLSVIFSAIIVLFGDYILQLFGAGFEEAYPALIVLVIGQLVNAMAGSVGYLMTMTGRQNEAMYVILFSAFANVALNAILIPIYGIEGAAIATVVSIVLWNLILVVRVRKYLGVNSTIFTARMIGKL